eukprot:GHVS01077867.1.p1 GENE.GHVS01077867.1~~GHVS01077867.1.p1  ORF type:complete len:516 (+),score=52.47 GHVS01077867.1:94-1641(+)
MYLTSSNTLNSAITNSLSLSTAESPTTFTLRSSHTRVHTRVQSFSEMPLNSLCCLRTISFGLCSSSPQLPTFGGRKVSSKVSMIGGLSRVGFGCYRVERGVREHEEALAAALKEGVNVIDTSANYADGAAEELVGDVLRQELVDRTKVHVISKFGYIQGQNLRRQYDEGLVFPETVDCGKYMKHCVHSDFMRDQLTRSLDRLGLTYLDAFLLHNPEYFITRSVELATEIVDTKFVSTLRSAMLLRISGVFEALEKEVQMTGRIKAYGISSNSFSVKADDERFLPYEGLVDLAKAAAVKVSGRPECPSSFKLLQFPGNLVETEGLEHCGKWAAEHGLAVLINRPLNAFNDLGSWRLAEYEDCSNEFKRKTELLLNRLRDVQGGSESLISAVNSLVTDLIPQMRSAVEWDSYNGRVIVPVLSRAMDKDRSDLRKQPELLSHLEDWRATVGSVVKFQSGVNARKEMQNRFGYSIPDCESLQSFALKHLFNSPGVACVLVGARKRRYVADVLQISNDAF